MGTQGKDKAKIIVILGPTASGKSDMAVSIAKKFNGEVVSADSRQVYKGLDIGSGKITKEEMGGVPHYLLDVASPKRRFTVSQYQKKAKLATEKILKKKKLPIICGGTPFYIDALVEGTTFPKVTPDSSLRSKLEKETNEDLLNRLRKFDKKRAENIDKKNRRRLIRAVEIVEKTGSPVPSLEKNPPYHSLLLGIKIDQERLNERIEKRLKKRMDEGMIDEVKKLRKEGVSFKRLESLGLEYRWVSLYLQNKVSYAEMTERLCSDIKKFSKRQMTWWKHDPRISWIKNEKEAKKLVESFLFTAS